MSGRHRDVAHLSLPPQHMATVSTFQGWGLLITPWCTYVQNLTSDAITKNASKVLRPKFELKVHYSCIPVESVKNIPNSKLKQSHNLL